MIQLPSTSQTKLFNKVQVSMKGVRTVICNDMENLLQLYSSTTEDLHPFPTQCLIKTSNSINISQDAANKNTVSNETKWIGRCTHVGYMDMLSFSVLPMFLVMVNCVVTTLRIIMSACWAGQVFVSGRGCSIPQRHHECSLITFSPYTSLTPNKWSTRTMSRVGICMSNRGCAKATIGWFS